MIDPSNYENRILDLNMKLLLKKNDQFAFITRVNFRKSQHHSVIGESLLFDYLHEQIPEGTDFHSHFIYIETGNYHYSIKYYDTDKKLFVDRKTYYNQIASRKGPSQNFTDETIERRDKNPEEILDSFMMDEPLSAWTHRPLGHQFSNVAFNLDNRNQRHLKWTKDLVAKDDDMIIDIDEVVGKTLNIHSALFSADNKAFDMSKLPENLD